MSQYFSQFKGTKRQVITMVGIPLSENLGTTRDHDKHTRVMFLMVIKDRVCTPFNLRELVNSNVVPVWTVE